jgi:hypothetical protein
MKCPKCHSENPVQFRFCGACGQPLGEAGDPGSLSEPESERRHVSVLFTDVTGDTINLASRLSGMGKAGEILVGPYTYRRAEGYFDFEPLELTPVEGKIEPVRFNRVLSRKDQPSKIHRLTGMLSNFSWAGVERT